jgi:molecular chaperone GrpE
MNSIMRTWFENEAILERVRQWLALTEDELNRAGDSPTEDAGAGGDGPPPVGLLPLVEAFTALRHELKLQTKSARGLEETVQTALAALDRAVADLRGIPSREAAAVERALQPLVMTLVELDEALDRGVRAFVATEVQVLERAADDLERALAERFAALSAWQRWRARNWHASAQQIGREQLAALSRQVMAPLREGYELIRARLQRLLAEQGIRRLDCVGRAVDPTQMTVVELVDDPQAAPETVLEELRPGYLWRDRVLRFAEVRAVRRRTAPEN